MTMTLRQLTYFAIVGLTVAWRGMGAEAPAGAYVLRPGDVVQWEIAGEAKPAQETKIGMDGMVTLDGLSAPLKVAGLDVGSAALAAAGYIWPQKSTPIPRLI